MEHSELQSRLESEVMEVEWDALAPHFARGALVLVDPELPIVMVAMAVGLDLADDVKGWMASGQVKPVDDQIAAGFSQDDKFRFLIVQPFVLAQPLVDALA